jgi:NO-binding membrane sensor protein with MHYT domain
MDHANVANPNSSLAHNYSPSLVILSIAIAIFASYSALDLAGRTSASEGRLRFVWTGTGAFAMGLGIWSMHYVGMLALTLPVRVLYDLPTVLVSLLAAVCASAVALLFVSRSALRPGPVLASSLVMGAGICAMHYIGMAAVSFFPAPLTGDISHSVEVTSLGTFGIAIITGVVLGVVTITSVLDRKFSAQAA